MPTDDGGDRQLTPRAVMESIDDYVTEGERKRTGTHVVHRRFDDRMGIVIAREDQKQKC